jgi:hypothetical protein
MLEEQRQLFPLPDDRTTSPRWTRRQPFELGARLLRPVDAAGMAPFRKGYTGARTGEGKDLARSRVGGSDISLSRLLSLRLRPSPLRSRPSFSSGAILNDLVITYTPKATPWTNGVEHQKWPTPERWIQKRAHPGC